MRKTKKKQSYFNENISNVKCHAGNCGNVNLRFFTVNFTMNCYFSLPKTVNLTVFYRKFTLNVPLDLLQLFTVYSTETFCKPIDSFSPQHFYSLLLLKSRSFFTVYDLKWLVSVFLNGSSQTGSATHNLKCSRLVRKKVDSSI